jgi:MFS family permease
MVADSSAESSFNSSLKVLPAIFATAGIFSWFFIVTIYFGKLFANVVSDPFWLLIAKLLFFGLGALSAVIGSIVRFNRRKILLFSLILGVSATCALAIVQGAAFAAVIGSLLGISFGVGFPISVALFADNTLSKNRGKYSGLLVLLTFLMISIGSIAIETIKIGLLPLISLTIIIRLTSLWAITDRSERVRLREISWGSIFADRSIIFYLISWIIFNLVSGFSNLIYPGLPKTADYTDAIHIGEMFQFIAVAVLSIPSGWICDRIGRRPPILFGTVMFSVSFAILAIAPTPLVVILQETTFGIAWGFSMVAYIAIPGDLAKGRSHEKIYALNTILPFIAYMLTSTLSTYITKGIPVNILSPILSILLVISIAFVLYAPETLLQSILNKRKMRKHLDDLEKVIAESKKKA